MRTALQNRISNYENWISSGCKGELPENMQKELLKLFSESKEAYNFYRNFLFKKLAELNDESNELDEFYRFLNSKNQQSEYSDVINHYSSDDTLDNFEDKRMNVFEIVSENTKNGISQNSCFLYQSYYEIDTILLILASFGVLNSEGRLELNHINLKDRSGRLKKGVCVDFIKARLKDFPKLLAVFSSAYNTKLRNTIGHNNYRIKSGTIESLDGATKVEQAEFFQSLYNLQKLNNFLVYFFSSEKIDTEKLKDCGILSIGFGFDNESPVFIVHQLECFYHLENNKNWLNKVEFNICRDQLKTNLFSKTPIKGVFNKELNVWFDTLKKQDLLQVIIQPIIPPINKTEKLLEIDCGKFEICADNYEKEIKYKINTCHNTGIYSRAVSVVCRSFFTFKSEINKLKMKWL